MFFNLLCVVSPSADGQSASSPIMLFCIIGCLLTWVACRLFFGTYYTGLPLILRILICIGGGILLGIILYFLIVGLFTVTGSSF